MRYIWAATLVALGLLIGFILQPAFGRSQAYATFYPVVMIAAYALGPKPAAAAAGLSAAVAYWCFIPPAFQWKWDDQVGAALAFFLVTSAVVIWLIGGMAQTLANRTRRPAADLARINAVIFADLGARRATSRPMMSVPTTAPSAARRAAHPSERSFDSVRAGREVAELEQAAPERPHKRRLGPATERNATLH